jgi:putative ABC transport system permease protein
MLGKQPAFTMIAVLTLALGIGANTVMFSVVNAVILRQLPFKDPDRLVWVWSTRTDRDKAFFSVPNLIDYRGQNQTLEEIVAFGNWGANLTAAGDPERLQGIRISANAFQMLGVEAAAGRPLLAEDDQPDKGRVVVLTHGLWRRRFGEDRGLIGKTLTLNGDSYTVVGVLPADFVIPNTDFELAVPLRMEADPRRNERGSNFLRVFARLKPGVTIQQARADLSSITDRLRQQYPDANGKFTAPVVLALHDEIVGSYRTALLFLLGAVGLVLLIACSNIANLQLARASARHRDIAIRNALGATRAKLIRQLLIESLMLALLGGVLGLLLSAWGKDLLLALSPADLPRVQEATVDLRVLLFSLSVSILTGITFGLAPAIRATKTSLSLELKEGSSGAFDGGARSRLRNGLVVAEVALSAMLLIGAGLFMKSFARLQSIYPGFEPSNLLATRISLPSSRYSKPEDVKLFYEKLEPRLGDLPGVESVAAANALPLSAQNIRTEFIIAGRPPLKPSDTPAAQDRFVSPSYFRTMKIPVVLGRDFTDADNEHGSGVAIVDETLARRYWPDENPIGAHLLVSFVEKQKPIDMEVVGVAGNVKHFELNEDPSPTFYAPLNQVPPIITANLANNMSIVVRGSVPSGSWSALVRRELRAVDPEVSASNFKTMAQLLSGSTASRRFNSRLLAIFAAAAFLLASVGVYGVISFFVSQRTREIGLRVALGAQSSDVMRLVVGQGMRITLLGTAAGLIGAFGLTRLISNLLYEVSPSDPSTFAVVAILMTGVALLACFIPAWRATKVDPLIALRYE